MVAFPRFKSAQFAVLALLKDIQDSSASEITLYAAELRNITDYLQRKLTGQAADEQQEYAHLYSRLCVLNLKRL